MEKGQLELKKTHTCSHIYSWEMHHHPLEIYYANSFTAVDLILKLSTT